MQNTKIRAAAFTCCLLFPQKRARDFRGLAQTPSAISRCLRATRLSATVIYFFTSFPSSVPSIFQFLFRQLTHTAGNTSSSVFACCQNSTLSLFFRSEVYSFFRKSPRFLPALAGHILPAAFLPILKPEPRVPACRPLLQIYHTYLTYKSQPLTFCSAGQNHSNHQPFPQTPSAISRCLRATSFPLHFAAAFHSSNIPFFLFFLSSTLFLFLFFFFLLSPFSFFSSLYYF